IFRAFLESALADAVAAVRRADSLRIDGALSANAITVETVSMIERAGPFGSGNPEPIVVLPSHSIAYADPVGEAHIRVRMRSGDGTIVDAIAFRAVGQNLGKAILANRGQRVHAAGCLAVDRWQGRERAQFRLIDIA